MIYLGIERGVFMADEKKYDIPEGYVIDDPDDNLREMGLSEEDIREINEEIHKEVTEFLDEAEARVTEEEKRLLAIIDDPNTSWEEKEAARRQLDPDMYDEDGNLVLDDSKFFDRLEEGMKRCYEEMKSKGLAI